jgi:beta-lactam-binding protein with PASTA domain
MRIVREVAYHFFLTFIIAMLSIFDIIEIAWVSANVMYYGKPKNENSKVEEEKAEFEKKNSEKLKSGKLKTGKKKAQDLDETVTKNLLIEDVQVSNKDFNVKQLAGLDLRDSYREGFMISNVMSKETA